MKMLELYLLLEGTATWSISISPAAAVPGSKVGDAEWPGRSSLDVSMS